MQKPRETTKPVTCAQAEAAMLPASQARLERAIERCRFNGWRLTPIRRRALESLCRANAPLKAYELIDRIGDDNRIASPMRVYRALDFLTGHGFVRHLKSINAFVWCDFAQEIRDVPFLICDRCGTTLPLTDPTLRRLLSERTEMRGFRADLETMELHGLCRACAESAET